MHAHVEIWLLDAASDATRDVRRLGLWISSLCPEEDACRVSKGLGKWIILFEIHRKFIMVDHKDVELDALFEAGLEIEEESQSMEELFNEALSSVQEARLITDKLQKAGVSPSTPTW